MLATRPESATGWGVCYSRSLTARWNLVNDWWSAQRQWHSIAVMTVMIWFNIWSPLIWQAVQLPVHVLCAATRGLGTQTHRNARQHSMCMEYLKWLMYITYILILLARKFQYTLYLHGSCATGGGFLQCGVRFRSIACMTRYYMTPYCYLLLVFIDFDIGWGMTWHDIWMIWYDDRWCVVM